VGVGVGVGVSKIRGLLRHQTLHTLYILAEPPVPVEMFEDADALQARGGEIAALLGVPFDPTLQDGLGEHVLAAMRTR
jgi:hypothetical protein